MRKTILAIAASFLFFPQMSLSAEPAPPMARYKYLEAELSQATKNKFYVVFDMERSKVVLKARGSVFREWPFSDVRQVGGEIPMEVLALVKRSYASEQLRVTIKPPEPEKEEASDPKAKKKAEELKPAEPAPPPTLGPPKIDALELNDMPFNYDLTFAKNLTVRVSADDPTVEKSFFDRFWEDAKETYRLYKLKKSGDSSILLSLKMSQHDARALYWALGDSMNVIFWAEPR